MFIILFPLDQILPWHFFFILYCTNPFVFPLLRQSVNQIRVACKLYEILHWLAIYCVISIFLRKSNINTKYNNDDNIEKNGIHSKERCRNEYGIGDQCRIYWLVLSARSDCTNCCLANG